MKKNFKFYAVCWVILLAVFNAVIFLARPVIPGFDIVYDARFWTAWAFILAAFVGNLICAFVAFKTEKLNKMFYSLPLITLSYTGVILTTVFGAGLMLIPACPEWIAAIVCLVVFALNVLAVVKAAWAGATVGAVDEKVKAQTQFVKLATANAQNILNRAQTEASKAACKKVYEALRYADPMSNDALSAEETKITTKMDELADAVNAGADNVDEIAEEIVRLVNERNNKCKALK